MTKPNWTPGEWRLVDSIGEGAFKKRFTMNDGSVVVMVGEQRICLVDTRAEIPKSKQYMSVDLERDANAHLIAAAPTMASALHLALDALASMANEGIDENTFNEGGLGYEAFEAIKAALARARGEG